MSCCLLSSITTTTITPPQSLHTAEGRVLQGLLQTANLNHALRNQQDQLVRVTATAKEEVSCRCRLRVLTAALRLAALLDQMLVTKCSHGIKKTAVPCVLFTAG